MRLGPLSAALILTYAPAVAQSLEPLQDAFGKLPELILTDPVPHQAYFVDVAAIVRLAEQQHGKITPQTFMRAPVGAMLPPVAALYSGDPADWQDRAGLGLSGMRYFIGFGSPPTTLTVWGLADEAAAAGLVETLTERDFQPTGNDGIIGNGAPMVPDLAGADRSNPWRSPVGAATFAGVKGNAVIQASTPDVLPAFLGDFDGASLNRNPMIETLIGGLEAAISDHAIVQAMLVSPVFGFGEVDPAVFLQPGPRDIDAVRDTLQDQIAATAEGIPAYLGGLIVDAHGDHPAVAISLAYPECKTAETAAKLMEERWVASMPDEAQGSTAIVTEGHPDGYCAAVLTVTGDSTDKSLNPAFSRVFGMIQRREFTVLQISTNQSPER